MVAAVEITNVSKSYGDVEVLVNASLVVEERTTLGLIGPSGAGKSTLLRCINHLETIDSGTIKVNGEMVGYRREGNRLFELGHSEIARRRADIGMAFARNSCDSVAIMVDGGIIEHGLPGDVLVNPQDARSRAFLRRVIG